MSTWTERANERRQKKKTRLRERATERKNKRKSRFIDDEAELSDIDLHSEFEIESSGEDAYEQDGIDDTPIEPERLPRLTREDLELSEGDRELLHELRASNRTRVLAVESSEGEGETLDRMTYADTSDEDEANSDDYSFVVVSSADKRKRMEEQSERDKRVERIRLQVQEQAKKFKDALQRDTSQIVPRVQKKENNGPKPAAFMAPSRPVSGEVSDVAIL